MPNEWNAGSIELFTSDELQSDKESRDVTNNVMVENIRKEVVHPSMNIFYVMILYT